MRTRWLRQREQGSVAPRPLEPMKILTHLPSRDCGGVDHTHLSADNELVGIERRDIDGVIECERDGIDGVIDVSIALAGEAGWGRAV